MAIKLKTPSLEAVGYSSIRFNRRASRYIDERGHFLSEATVRAVIDADLDATARRMDTLAAACEKLGVLLTQNKISRRKFDRALNLIEAQMGEEVSGLHLANVAAACGGFHNMNQSSWGRAGQRIRFHKSKMTAMFAEFRANPLILVGQAGRKMRPRKRFALYAHAGLSSYERMRRVEMKRHGKVAMSNVLEPEASHCTDCPAHTARGRVAIDDKTYRMPGDRECRKCRCRTRYWDSF